MYTFATCDNVINVIRNWAAAYSRKKINSPTTTRVGVVAWRGRKSASLPLAASITKAVTIASQCRSAVHENTNRSREYASSTKPAGRRLRQRGLGDSDRFAS